MKTLKLIAIAITAATLAAPAFAGPDYAQLAAQKAAFDRLNGSKALAGSTGPKGVVGPATIRVPATPTIGHPTERVRR